LELAHTICICQALYVVTISEYGRPQLLDIPPQSLNVAILFSGFIGPIEQVRGFPIFLGCTVQHISNRAGSPIESTNSPGKYTFLFFAQLWRPPAG